VKGSAKALLDLDRIIWQAQGNLEHPDVIAQARDLFREELAILGTRKYLSTSLLEKYFAPVIEQLLSLRQRFREEKDFIAGDMIRDALSRSGIIVEDTPEGPRWSLMESKKNS
jgi:cysteinyl-tRNA synthetase